MPDQNTDAYGHVGPIPKAVSLTAGALGTSVAGTISPNANAGASATVTAVTAIDQYGAFQLNAVGTPAAGIAASVRFAQSYERPPRCIQVTVTDITTPATPAAVAVSPGVITSAGFDVTTPALTTAHNYLVNYSVDV